MTTFNQLPEASLWHHEEKAGGWTEYYVLLADGKKPPVSLILKHNSETKEIQSDIYTPPDIDYTIHDGCDHENDECWMNYPESSEHQDVEMADKYSRAVCALEKQVKQQKQAARLIEHKQKMEGEVHYEQTGNREHGQGNDR